MAEENDSLGFSINADELEGLAEDEEVRWLTVERMEQLPAWNKVRICHIEKKGSDYGDYLKITFMCAKRSYKVGLNFFSSTSYRRLLPALGISVLERRSQLMNRVVWVNFTTKLEKGKEYIRIADYRDKEPDNNPVSNPTGNVPQQESIDDVPF